MNQPTASHPSPTAHTETLGYRRLHFIGVGGVGMSAVALGAIHAGADVSGSDLSTSRFTDMLKAHGARILLGHAAGHVSDAQAVVVSTAIREDNPEFQRARERGLPILHRSEVLAALMAPHQAICVAGSHGKTTTTAMLGCMLEFCGFDPSVYVGGYVEQYNGNARLGKGQYVVAEADESDGSFLRLPVDLAVVSNIEPEHLDYWGDGDQLLVGFRRFLKNVRPGGYAVVNADDPGVRRVLCGLGMPVLTSSIQSDFANFTAHNIRLLPFGSEFEFVYEGQHLGPVRLLVPGIHNVSNATTAIGAVLGLGGDFDRIVSALAHFHGVGRRFQVIGESRGVLVIDDYGHHPTEVAATLRAAQETARSNHGRLVAIFQPHRYTRTRSHCHEFGAAFDACDDVVVTDVYPAGEKPIEGVTGRLVVDSIADHGHRSVAYSPSPKEAVTHVLPRLRPGDLVITIGAGDIYKIGHSILEALTSGTSPAPVPAVPAATPAPEV